MKTFYVTFGQKYRRESHPVLGFDPRLPDGWYEVKAETLGQAHRKVMDYLGPAWAFLEDRDSFSSKYYPVGCLGTI